MIKCCVFTIILLSLVCCNDEPTQKSKEEKSKEEHSTRISRQEERKQKDIISKIHKSLGVDFDINSKVSNWSGVTVDGDGYVTWFGFNTGYSEVISVSDANLDIHIRELSYLPKLKNLYFFPDRFKGWVPNEIAMIRSLEYLSFGANEFYGELSARILLLPKLRWLNISSTKIKLPYGAEAIITDKYRTVEDFVFYNNDINN